MLLEVASNLHFTTPNSQFSHSLSHACLPLFASTPWTLLPNDLEGGIILKELKAWLNLQEPHCLRRLRRPACQSRASLTGVGMSQEEGKPQNPPVEGCKFQGEPPSHRGGLWPASVNFSPRQPCMTLPLSSISQTSHVLVLVMHAAPLPLRSEKWTCQLTDV